MVSSFQAKKPTAMIHGPPHQASHIRRRQNPSLAKHHQDPIMCRSNDHNFGPHRPGPDRLLSIKAFYLRLRVSPCSRDVYSDPLSGSLTLVYLPRINGSPLEVNGSGVRPNMPAYVTLHRAVNAGAEGAGSVVFGSLERVRAGEGVRFEVYIGEEKLLKGVFRREKTRWRVDCACVLEREVVGVGVAEAEICVAVEGGTMREKVAVEERRRRKHGAFDELEEIPEEDETEEEESACSSSGGCSCCCERWLDGKDDRVDEDLTAAEEAEMEDEMEGIRWAVDLGIWVVCLGVGYLVSRASAKSLRQRKTLLTSLVP